MERNRRKEVEKNKHKKYNKNSGKDGWNITCRLVQSSTATPLSQTLISSIDSFARRNDPTAHTSARASKMRRMRYSGRSATSFPSASARRRACSRCWWAAAYLACLSNSSAYSMAMAGCCRRVDSPNPSKMATASAKEHTSERKAARSSCSVSSRLSVVVFG